MSDRIMNQLSELSDEEIQRLSEDFLAHYGTPRHSGRYPWGSGDNPYQRTQDFGVQLREAQSRGLTYTEFAKELGVSSGYVRTMVSRLKAQEEQEQIIKVQRLKKKGLSNVAIGEMMGISEGKVRLLEKKEIDRKESAAEATAKMLKAKVGTENYIDVSSGVEKEIGISSEKLKVALDMLKDRGYSVVTAQIPNATDNSKTTNVNYLLPPGHTLKDLYNNLDRIQSYTEYTHDNGETFVVSKPPTSVDSKRVYIRYNEEGGVDKDGTIEIRRGVEDLSLGNAHYAQTRIMVDDAYYMKGMAFYSDKVPEGYDLVYNVNKHEGTAPEKVFKPIKDDPANPFGAYIPPAGQTSYIDSKTGEEKLSPINKIKEEGDWEHYSKSLSAQFLSKQSMTLINRQLNLTMEQKKADLKEIMELENPELKKEFLNSFADECDRAAVNLKAAALPRQTSKVLLPVPELKDNEVYAPTYKNGEQLALIRYPHGGIFEIPILTVNNNNKYGKETVGPNSIDAIGINPTVAGILSGADFDGDSVLTIPVNENVKIKNSKPLKDLEGFNPSDAYPGYPGMKILSEEQKQIQMGVTTNLVNDMTLKGASTDEIARAVRHSMVIIDAVKHELDYKRSEKENRIDELKKLYQSTDPDNPNKHGASTLISRAKSEERVPERKRVSYKPNPETGKYDYEFTGRTRIVYKKDKNTGLLIRDENGKPIPLKEELVTEKSTKMAETDDAYTLSSGTKQENAYANYANTMKALAIEARKASLKVESSKADPEAKKKYTSEINSINDKINEAIKNQPRERMAQVRANRIIKEAEQKDPLLRTKSKKDEYKKLKQKAITESRGYYGAQGGKVLVRLNDKEWEAIQNKAIGSTLMNNIIRYGDKDELRKRATPKSTVELSSAKQQKIATLRDSGLTLAQIAESVGVSTSTVVKYM